MSIRPLALVLTAVALVTGFPASAAEPPLVPVPRATCGPGSLPETGRQGRVSAEDVAGGRAAKGYRCNTVELSHFGESGGYKVERYVDKAGHECAVYDTTLLFPVYPGESATDSAGAFVLDMADPAKPVLTDTLLTPAMQSPHESMLVNQKRGLLAAVLGNPVFYPGGQVDLYDMTADCRHPALKASAPVGVFGHESGFAPDGNTLYVASLFSGTLTAVDVSDPAVPKPLVVANYPSHGLSLNDAGIRAYVAVRRGVPPNDSPGLLILDTSEIQRRVTNPQMRVVSWLTWSTVSTPQIPLPVTIKGHPYLVEMDEFGDAQIGAARIIDIADDTKPFVVSNIRLEVNMAANRASQSADPGATTSLKRYAGHYCSVPTRVDPEVVACTFILSGLRLFDIRDPIRPREIAYFNPPPQSSSGNYAMSSVAFVPERSELWYSDGNNGFYAVKVTNGVWPFPATKPAPAAPAKPVIALPRAEPGDGGNGETPATGGAIPLAMVLLLGTAALGLRLLSRRT